MREPEASGAGGDEQRAGIPDDHPVMVAIRNAPLATDPMTEDELAALEEFRALMREADG